MSKEHEGVSVVVRRRVDPARTEDFEAWLAGVIDVASGFEGHQGAQVLRPGDAATQDYVLLFRFATPAQLKAWETSEDARTWLKKAEPFTRDLHIERLTGLEFWFRAPGGGGRRPPARIKMAVATVVGLYPLILFVAPLLAGVLAPLPRPLAVLGSTFVMVLLMTYAVMPVVTRALARWLFAR
ncbi:MAG: antibiotic biosynthesis monooxygenase [Myxococcota bacterium]